MFGFGLFVVLHAFLDKCYIINEFEILISLEDDK